MAYLEIIDSDCSLWNADMLAGVGGFGAGCRSISPHAYAGIPPTASVRITSYGPSEGWRPPQDDIISWGCFGDAVPEGLRSAEGFGEVDGNAHAACCAAVSATAWVGIASSGPSEGLRPPQDDIACS